MISRLKFVQDNRKQYVYIQIEEYKVNTNIRIYQKQVRTAKNKTKQISYLHQQIVNRAVIRKNYIPFLARMPIASLWPSLSRIQTPNPKNHTCIHDWKTNVLWNEVGLFEAFKFSVETHIGMFFFCWIVFTEGELCCE